MLVTIEATFLIHAGHVTGFVQKRAGLFMVSSEERSGNNRDDLDFGIVHLKLLIFRMVKSLQKIITQAIKFSKLRVHVSLMEYYGWVIDNFTRIHIDFFGTYPRQQLRKLINQSIPGFTTQ